MYRKKKTVAAQSAFTPEGGDAFDDGATKYAYSCFAPNTKLAELMKDPLPEWYDAMRQLAQGASDTPNEDSSLRCLTTLGSVYGVSISQPTTSSFEPKGNEFLDIMIGDNIPLDVEGSLSADAAASAPSQLMRQHLFLQVTSRKHLRLCQKGSGDRRCTLILS